jgi:hypothetical protein
MLRTVEDFVGARLAGVESYRTNRLVSVRSIDV